MPKTTRITPALSGLLDDQAGVVTTGQLAHHSFGPNAVQHRVGKGAWRRLLPGVVLTSSGPPTRRQLVIGAWLWAGTDAAIDGADACVWHGFTTQEFDPGVVHVVVPQSSALRSRGYVVVRRACAEIRTSDDGFVPHVSPATAVISAARCCRSGQAAIALLSRALQVGLVTSAELHHAREEFGDKWCGRLDRALGAVGVGIRSPLENDNRKLVLTSTVLPEPLWNQWLDLGDGGALVCADVLWVAAGLVEEVLGKRYHAWGEQFESTERRRTRMVAAGLVMQGATARAIRQGDDLLRQLERTYLRHAGHGLPDGVRLVDPPTIAARLP